MSIKNSFYNERRRVLVEIGRRWQSKYLSNLFHNFRCAWQSQGFFIGQREDITSIEEPLIVLRLQCPSLALAAPAARAAVASFAVRSLFNGRSQLIAELLRTTVTLDKVGDTRALTGQCLHRNA